MADVVMGADCLLIILARQQTILRHKGLDGRKGKRPQVSRATTKNPFYHSVAEPPPKTRTLTTEATEEHEGNPKSNPRRNQKPTAEFAETAEGAGKPCRARGDNSSAKIVL
jgi:hypothetical protein